MGTALSSAASFSWMRSGRRAPHGCGPAATTATADARGSDGSIRKELAAGIAAGALLQDGTSDERCHCNGRHEQQADTTTLSAQGIGGAVNPGASADNTGMVQELK